MRNIMVSFVALLLFSSIRAFGGEKIGLSKAIIVTSSTKKVQTKAAEMLRDEIEKRTRIGLDIVSEMPGTDEVAIIIGTAKELAEKSYRPPAGFEVPSKADAYALWIDTTKRQAATICAAGHDDRGTLFAVGRLLRVLEMSRDKIQINSNIKLATAPKYSLRGHQFGYRPKTNSYDGWTIKMWEQYYRDMVVFGMNALELVPPRTDDASDSPHFPKSQMEMMVEMSRLADEYGLDVWIWYPVMDPVIDDKYYVPRIIEDLATVELALKEREEVFKKLPRIDAVFVPGGDPGEIHPKYLFPFMEKEKKILNRYHPKATIWSSTQNYDDEEKTMGWSKAFYDKLKQSNWMDGVVFGPAVETTLANLRKEVPSKYPIRRYPDITHSMSCQYEVPDWDRAYRITEGREPINPRPRGYAKIFRDLQQYSFGFITYSEGCNDDVNKVVWSCLGWDPDMKVEDILKDYSRYFISSRYEEKFAQGLLALEKNWEGPLLTNEGVFETLNLFQKMEKDALPQELLNWRFQQGLYRAYYDAYIRYRLIYETKLEQEAMDLLKTAEQIGSLAALEKAEVVLDKAVTEKPARDLRARVFELAEALFQSIRMQLSVSRYKAISVGRGANLDTIDLPLNNRSRELKRRSNEIRKLPSEKERLEAIAQSIH